MGDADRSGTSDGADDRGADDASDARAETVRTRPCPFCGASMHHRHCKYVCPAHGVVMDCSDTFVHR